MFSKESAMAHDYVEIMQHAGRVVEGCVLYVKQSAIVNVEQNAFCTLELYRELQG